jgi:RNA polymerase sigma factor (sigma-70 family)
VEPTAANSESINCGDPAAVSRLYQKTGPLVLSKIGHLVGDRQAGLDILQETFARLLDKRPTFPNIRAAYTWLYQTCHHLCVDRLRSYHHRMGRPLGLVSEPLARCTLVPRTEALQLLSLLSQRDAEILCYVIVDEMPQEQIATTMDASRKTVQRVTERALEKLRNHGGSYRGVTEFKPT